MQKRAVCDACSRIFIPALGAQIFKSRVRAHLKKNNNLFECVSRTRYHFDLARAASQFTERREHSQRGAGDRELLSLRKAFKNIYIIPLGGACYSKAQAADGNNGARSVARAAALIGCWRKTSS